MSEEIKQAEKTEQIPPKKVVFYFDGFNFYHGFKSYTGANPDWKNYYWIDFVKFCSQFVFAHDGQVLHKVKYFTAPPINLQKRSKQSALFGANKVINGDTFEVLNGHYADKYIDCLATCKETFRVPEEKCTDVNIALNIVGDCMDNQVDVIVLVTADSDQVSTVKFIQKKFPHIKIKLYFPPNRASNELKSLFKQVVYLEKHEDKFKNAKMTFEVKNEKKTFTRPADWKK
ncbi:NYN domain-containing protein [Flavobacterium sp. N1719]|uniref:NYN domain-containing protein n=1 Tax=Flavobacterium sp. N1719 TaxID=2885633 RepID=UPI0022233513|nr:NYN domain-containing protein [Flavobacterium sp. N1719]